MARAVKDWVGRTDDSMPTIHVLLRLYSKQNGLCACGCGIVMNMERDQIDCDHKTPLRDGGENVESNLQLMLQVHHREKTKAENVARGRERQHKAKAFKSVRPPSKFASRGFESRPKQHSATRPLRRRSEQA
jgi:5-methylcytosine-specific restriction enzyme A